ncbi:MAG: hypothetical protein QOE10_823, partial [Gaiellales bacterium]|nr:hypothetical protein [Gaiellales bacterium]
SQTATRPTSARPRCSCRSSSDRTSGGRDLHPLPASRDNPGGGGCCERAPPLVFRPARRFPEIKTLSGLSESRRLPYLVGADPRRRCDDRKRLVVATCTPSDPRMKCRVRQRDLRVLHGGAGEPSAEFEPAPRTQRRPPGTFRRLTTCRGSSTTKSGADDSRHAKTTGFGLVNTQRRPKDQGGAHSRRPPRCTG